MARFKVPKRVVFGELPKTATGKIEKLPCARGRANGKASLRAGLEILIRRRLCPRASPVLGAHLLAQISSSVSDRALQGLTDALAR